MIYICMFLYITVNCVMRCYISRYYDVVVDDDDGALTHQLLSFFVVRYVARDWNMMDEWSIGVYLFFLWFFCYYVKHFVYSLF